MPVQIGLFADVQNIYYTTRQIFGKPFNYRALWAQLSASADIRIANAYAIDRGDGGQMKFQNALHHMGFQVKLKPYIRRADGSAKGDWDVGIALDVMEAAAGIDRVVLLSGDGDFDLLLERARALHGVETHVYGVERLTAQSLIAAADEFHPIDDALLMR